MGGYALVFVCGMFWGIELKTWVRWYMLRKIRPQRDEIVKHIVIKLTLAEKFGGEITLKGEGLKMYRQVIQHLAKEAELK